MSAAAIPDVKALRVARSRRIRAQALVVLVLAFLVVGLWAASLMFGESFYGPSEVWRVIAGERVPGASFTVGTLRLPRATLAVLAGLAFGSAGVTFQTLLRNQLASPDVIGISAGASAAGVIGIVILGLNETTVSLLALAAAIGTAVAIYALSYKGGFAGTRLILIGIGVSSMLGAVVTYTLAQASAWDLQVATRWLTGSLNSAGWPRVAPLAATCAVILPSMWVNSSKLAAMRFGDDTASGLGVKVFSVRVWTIIAAVTLVAVATASCGPIAFVAFMFRADSGADQPLRLLPGAARLPGRRDPGAGLRPDRSVRLRRPLSRRHHHWCSRRPVPRLPPHPLQPAAPELTPGDPVTANHSLTAVGLGLAYGDRTVIDNLDLTVKPGAITSIVGANGCGKSTLLRSLARLLQPRHGQVLLDGKSLHEQPTKEIAKVLGLLPQSPTAPEGIVVADLVGRGRHPHQGMLGRWSPRDYEVVAESLAATDTTELADRPVDELSGGQRQRVWIAMALAQETDILLLDEPTTYLDVANQLEVLDLLIDLNARRGTTVVMVLHDLGLAARYSDELIAMRSGSILAQGTPSDVVTEETVREVFGISSKVVPDPVSGAPLVMPIGRHRVKRE